MNKIMEEDKADNFSLLSHDEKEIDDDILHSNEEEESEHSDEDPDKEFFDTDHPKG